MPTPSTYTVETVTHAPRIFVARNFLSDAECKHLISAGVAKGRKSSASKGHQQERQHNALHCIMSHHIKRQHITFFLS
jgi:hypothetical protein